MPLNPMIGTAITITNHNYAHRYRPAPNRRPRFEADRADLEQLLLVSQAPASSAITTAVEQFLAPPRPRTVAADT